MAPKPPWHNDAQKKLIEERWEFCRALGMDRPNRNLQLNVCVRCSRIGPMVTSQELGKYYSNLAAGIAGRPRATTKTPEQLEMLQESFADDPYPTTLEMISLIHSSGLTRKQAQDWFCNERTKAEKNGEVLITRNKGNNPNVSAKLWREFEKDRDAFLKKYFVTDESTEEEQDERLKLRRDLGIFP